MPRDMKVLATTDEDLLLRELRPNDGPEYHALVQRNAAHLTRLGDFQDEVATGVADTM